MASVYILQSLVNLRYYIGSTNNWKRRLEEHNQGKSKYTRSTRPFKLVFIQHFESLAEARRIESRLKKFKSRVIIGRVIKDGYIKIANHTSKGS